MNVQGAPGGEDVIANSTYVVFVAVTTTIVNAIGNSIQNGCVVINSSGLGKSAMLLLLGGVVLGRCLRDKPERGAKRRVKRRVSLGRSHAGARKYRVFRVFRVFPAPRFRSS